MIYASDTATLAAMEVIVHHGGIPQDYVGIRVDIPDAVRVLVADVPPGWPDLVPEDVTREAGTAWVKSGESAVLRVPSATMSVAGYNYVLNPSHPEFAQISFRFEPVTFHKGLRPRD